MTYFLANIGYGLSVLALWFVCGLGPLLLLLPKAHRSNAFLLAPLFGLLLLVLIGLFQITVLLIPLYAKTNVISLVFVSITILFWKRQIWIPLLKKVYRRLLWLSLFPIGLLLAFGILFHQSGYYLLVGGSDQLQYCMNANHIANVMHTGSVLDSPVPRQDYFIAELCTRILPYLKSYRRGAEVILATDSRIIGLNTIETFPITILCALLTLGFALGYIARVGFRLTLAGTLFLQLVFLSSFYFLLLHIQGSLALTLSLAAEFVTLAFLLQMVQIPTWRWVVLCAITMAGYLSIYTEPALITILLPIIFLMLWQFSLSPLKGIKTLALFLVLGGFVSLLAPYAIYSFYENTIGNIEIVKHGTNTILSLKEFLQAWVLAPVVLGIQSYYDNSTFNDNCAHYFANFPWVGAVSFVLVSFFAVLGFLRSQKKLGYVYVLIMLTWLASSLIQAQHQDGLRFARSLHYAMPFVLLGLCLLAANVRKKQIWPIASWFGRAVVSIFVVMNIYTGVRVFNFLLAHNIDNDPILLRVQTQAEQWQRLKQVLYYSGDHQVPVLISGFKETIRPLALANLMASQTHVLGTSMDFWPIYGPQLTSWRRFNTRLSLAEFTLEQKNENKSWDIVNKALIGQSMQAVVAVGSGYPKEWKSDVFAPHIERFNNICDVVYRDEFVAKLPSRILSNLETDQEGVFRWVKSSGPVIIEDHPNKVKTLVIEFSGNKDDLHLKIKNSFFLSEQTNKNTFKLSAKVQPDEVNQLMLIVSHPVKLRTMSWGL